LAGVPGDLVVIVTADGNPHRRSLRAANPLCPSRRDPPGAWKISGRLRPL
jgi:hypothetical protein